VTNQYGNAKVSVYGVGHKQGANYNIYDTPSTQQKENKETDKIK
jgi:hypothetical protein